ncbi:MAG: DUF881 domain-containing protein [bacterium]|nr:DUF881 domain-containing protein [bacterium]
MDANSEQNIDKPLAGDAVELVVPDPDESADQVQPDLSGADVLVANYSLEALSDQPEASPKHGSVKVKLHERLEREFHSYSWKIPVALACILLGIMIGLQYRTQANNIPVQADDRRKMLELVRTLEAERNKLSSELTEVRGRIADIEDAAGKRDSLSKQVQEQLMRSRIEAGLTGMKGPGVTVTLTDSPRTPAPDEDPYFYIIHDVDLQALVNELWAAGAEAVSVNEQRVVTRTSIRCVGPTVLVNGVRLAAPYTVKGIGPSDLETALRMPGGFLDSMAPLISRGGEVKVSRTADLSIAPFEGSLAFRYSQAFEKPKEPIATTP